MSVQGQVPQQVVQQPGQPPAPMQQNFFGGSAGQGTVGQGMGGE